MDKSNKKAPYKIYNPAIIKKLVDKYGVTRQFIGASIRGDRTSETSTKICEDYKQMEIEINKTIKEL